MLHHTWLSSSTSLCINAHQYLLAGSTFKNPVSPVALRTVGLSLFGTFTVTDEIELYRHLLIEAQRFHCNDLRLAT